MGINERRSDGIAIVGAAALYPDAINGQTFWRNILAGRDSMCDVPGDHWLVDDYYDPDPRASGKIYAQRGGFLPRIDFDPLEHGLPPRQLATTDTAQLLALVVAQSVLDDTISMQLGKISRRDVSVILGVASATELVGQMAGRIQRPHWVKALRDVGLPESQVQDVCDRIESTYPEWDESTFPGLLGNVVAGRIANRLDLGGTNCVVDAACASSLGAVAMAVQELRLRTSDMVITGGVDALNDAFMYMCFSRTQALSPTGDCRPFAEAADGTMLGEGLGMVALRRLADAERDGDKIYAVLRGIGSSSDGRAKSIYAPRPEGQEIALRRAYDDAGYGPQEVELIEAHGTATRAGDIAEFDSLRRVFSDSGPMDRQWCALGSVKSQIGHTKAAAGAASLFKVVMALHHKVLPPTIKVEQPNVKLEMADSPFYLNTETRPWIHAPGDRRKGSVSSFGFGGSNFHVTLEEYASDRAAGSRHSGLPANLLLFGAQDSDDLIAKAKAARTALHGGALPALARDSQLAFLVEDRYRLAVLAPDVAAADATLTIAIERLGKDAATAFSLANRLYYSVGVERPKLAFLFPGQGSQYVNMGRDLAIEFDAARGLWDDTAALDFGSGHKLHQLVFPRPVYSDADRSKQFAELTRTHWAQPAIGATSLSMLRLLDLWGVRPDATAGHSYGEISALYAGGVISTVQDMLSISRRRGELMNAAASNPGGMLAVRASVRQLEQLIAAQEIAGVAIANVNSPKQVVVAGETHAMEAFQHTLREAGVACQRLPVATAFHTEMVAYCAEPFGRFLDGVQMGAPRVPVYSNDATRYPPEPEAIRAMLARQLAEPVQFAKMIEQMHTDGCRLFIEIGPGSALTSMVADTLVDVPHVAVSLDNRKLDGRAALLNGLAVLAINGIQVDYAAFWRDFAPFEAPESGKMRSSVAVKLGGANYGKPYPPEGGSAARTAPDSEQANAAPGLKEAAVVPASVLASSREQASSASPVLTATVSPASGNRETFPDESRWGAFQRMQQQVLEAQKNFTEAMSASHLAFLRTSEAAFLQLGALGGSISAESSEQLLFRAPITPAEAMPAARDIPPAMALPVSMADSSNHVLVPPVAPTVLAPGYEAMLLAVVSEKTGYPIEMLNLDMELEAGLGIDSIKRVEILSALQERVPLLADVDTAALAALSTLGEIVSFAVTGTRVAATDHVVHHQRTGPIDHEALLLAAVAEKTGYPIDMLTLDMELEAGLGIDSIKRVEILSALQEQIPQLAGVDTAALAALSTLGEIVKFASSSTIEGAFAAIPPKPARESTSGLRRLIVDVADLAAPGLVMPGLFKGDTLYLVGGGDALGAALVARLAVAGVRARAVDIPPEDALAVMILSGLDPIAVDAYAQLQLNETVFRHLRRCAASMAEHGTLLVTVQATGGAFGLDGLAGDKVWSAGIAAAAKTAAREWPNVTVKAIDVETSGRDGLAIADALFGELLTGGSQLEVGLKANGRRVTPATRIDEKPVAVPVNLPEHGVIVVTGGARGITAACLAELLARTPARIAIFGRTPLHPERPELAMMTEDGLLKRELLRRHSDAGRIVTPIELEAEARELLAQRELRSNFDKLAALGGDVRYYCVDVRDAEAVAAAIAEVREGFGPIHGLIHAAGVLADKEIGKKTPEQYRAVLQTKVDGLRNLLDATGNDQLTHIVCFSSVAARHGNVGQIDYAMANEVLNRVCQAEQVRRGQSCLVKAIGWGPWAGGMVDGALAKHFTAKGVALIPLAEGARFLTDEYLGLNGDAPEIIFSGGLELSDAVDRIPAEPECFDIWFHSSTYPLLASHVVRDLPVLPLVVANDIALQAVRAWRPDAAIEGTANIEVVKGIRLSNYRDAGEHFRVECRSTDAAVNRVKVRILGRGAEVHYRLDVCLGSLPIGWDVGDDREPTLGPWQPKSGVIYDGRLFHGPDLQVIEGLLGISDEGCAGVLRARGPKAVGADAPVDVLDGGLQLAVLWGHEHIGRASLPTGADAIHLLGPWPHGEPVYCSAVCEARRPLTTRWTLRYSSAGGDLLGLIRGLRIHSLADAEYTTATAH